MFDRLKSLLDNVHQAGSSTSPALLHREAAHDVSVQNPEYHPPAPPQIAKRPAPVASATGISFSVDDVVCATDPLWQSTLGESVEFRTCKSILIMPDPSQPALAAEGYGGRSLPRGTAGVEPLPPQPLRATSKRLSSLGTGSAPEEWLNQLTFLHPLVQAVHLAFSDHRPLILSPDCIWLAIVQGFGLHLQENAEALRHRIVRHDGKKMLVVQTPSLSPSLWPELISQFSGQIRDNSDPVLHETLLCDFSTTTPTIRTACEVALMDSYQRYFEYVMRCVCGIPKITLEGTPEDWQRMRDRIEVLATYGLEWWTSRLAPILDQFIATAKGDPDHSFWGAIYKPGKAYAAETATGWIADLFPYLGDASARRRNHVLSVERTNWLPPIPSRPMPSVGVSLKSFPNGLSTAPVKVVFPDRTHTEVDLMGGFLGVSQRPEDNALSPIISWAVVEKSSSPDRAGGMRGQLARNE